MVDDDETLVDALGEEAWANEMALMQGPSVSTSLANEIAETIELSNAKLIMESVFLRDVETAGLWDRRRLYDAQSALTIFVPLNHTSSAHNDLVELWNRHTADGLVRVGSEGAMQLVTRSKKLVYALYPLANSSTPHVSTTARHAIGAVAISDAYNVEYNGCIFHAISTALPELRPVPGLIATFRTTYVSGETIDFQFVDMGIDPAVEDGNFTLVASLTDTQRVPFAQNQKTSWHGNGTQCSFVVPSVPKRQNGMLWLSLYDNRLRHPVVTMVFPWYVVVEPNALQMPNPRILDINPKVAGAQSELWIRGHGFDERTIRVMFDNQVAQVFGCDRSLIRCYVPPLSAPGEVHVWVANANVYTRYDGRFTFTG